MQLTVTTQPLLHTLHTFYTPSFLPFTSTLLHSLSPGFQLSTWDAGNASHREPVSYVVLLYSSIPYTTHYIPVVGVYMCGVGNAYRRERYGVSHAGS